MILLSDNDVWLKLAQYDLVDAALDWLAPGGEAVFVLPTLRFWLRLHQPQVAVQRHGQDVVDRLTAALLRVHVLPDAPDAALVSRFLDHAGIDAGEALLFLALTARPEALLATGDKRSIAAFAKAPDLADLATACAGRVLCLEQILDGLLCGNDGERVVARLFAARHVDKALAVVVGSQPGRSVAEVRHGLASYIGKIRGDSGGLLRKAT